MLTSWDRGGGAVCARRQGRARDLSEGKGVAVVAKGYTQDRRVSPLRGSEGMLPQKIFNYSMPEMENLTLFAIESTRNKILIELEVWAVRKNICA